MIADGPDAKRAHSESIQWMVRLSSGEATDADRSALRLWRRADPENERAWQRLVAIESDFVAIPDSDRPVAGRVLASAPDRSRRKLLSLIGLSVIGGGLAWAYRDEVGLTGALADLGTATGEQQTVTFPDGGALTLNTASAADIVEQPGQRRIALHLGEIFVRATGGTRQQVVTPGARIAADAADFIVRRERAGSRLAVLTGNVAIDLTARPGAQQAKAGDRLLIKAGQIGPDPATGQIDPTAWLDGKLIVQNMPLGAFVEELWRYRNGWAQVAPEVAGLGVSGVYRIDRTDDALSALEATLPIKISRYSKYIVRVTTRA